MPARRATRIERTGEDFARHPNNAQFVRFRNQLLKDHRTMAKCVSAGQVFFTDAVRVHEVINGVHAYVERAEELRNCLAVSLSEELSSCGGVVGNESVRDAQPGARGEPELALFVFSVALALKIVYPASVVKRVEKTFERGDGLADAH